MAQSVIVAPEEGLSVAQSVIVALAGLIPSDCYGAVAWAAVWRVFLCLAASPLAFLYMEVDGRRRGFSCLGILFCPLPVTSPGEKRKIY